MSNSITGSSVHTTKIVNCQYFDTQTGQLCSGEILCADGVFTSIGPAGKPVDPQPDEPIKTIDAADKLVIPGMIDCYARLREPGFEKSATIATEAGAAAANGITTIMCSPDTDPVTDETATVELIKRRAAAANGVRVLPIGALTTGLAGDQLSEMLTLADAGCVAFSNGDQPMHNTQVLRRVMEYATGFNLKLIIAPQDPWLSGGVAHEGTISTRLGLPGIPSAAETVALAQLIELCYQTGASAHFSRLSTQRGVSLVSQAKLDGISITADTCIDNLFLTEMDVSDFNSHVHTSPPLRSRRDLEALRQGLADGVIDAICSNHAPRETDAKLAPFSESEPGISALDTFFSLLVKLSREMTLPFSDILNRVTVGPATCFGLPYGGLSVTATADFCIVDMDEEYEFTRQSMLSAGKNSPYENWLLPGQVDQTFVAGSCIFNRSADL